MIQSTQNHPSVSSQIKVAKNGTPKSAAKAIATSFGKMIDEVNQDQTKAEKMVTEMVAGKNKDIAKTMIAMEKADVSLRLLMAVRNKMINAYQEMTRMQV